MPIAELRNGEIRPLEPLPPDWQDGQRLRVESVEDDDATPAEIDRDFALEAHEQAKQQVRRQMGLS